MAEKQRPGALPPMLQDGTPAKDPSWETPTSTALGRCGMPPHMRRSRGAAPGGSRAEPWSCLAFALAALLTGCGDLPQPFLGHPGATAQRLSHPPPSRLDVPTPATSLLSDQAASVWSVMAAHALDDQAIPAAASPARRDDWQLRLSATLHGAIVTPSYALLNPRGETQGTTDGTPVPAARWASGDPAMLRAETTASAPRIIALMTSVDAAIRQSDPNSLVNRPARIFFSGVTGAPGDGNATLARQLRLQLPDTGDVVQGAARDADFTVRGEVHVVPDPHDTERVEVTWIVTDSENREAGRVAQLNDVPKGTLDVYWGDVALVVAQQAASGIHDVITNSSGRRSPKPGKPTATRPVPAASAQPKATPAGS